jgi:aspartate kinase
LEGKRLGKVHGEDHLAKVSLVGQGLHGDPDLVARMARELRQKEVPFYGWNVAELRASFFVPTARADVAVQALHQQFIYQGARP